MYLIKAREQQIQAVLVPFNPCSMGLFSNLGKILCKWKHFKEGVYVNL